jgi:hypothetical protein
MSSKQPTIKTITTPSGNKGKSTKAQLQNKPPQPRRGVRYVDPDDELPSEKSSKQGDLFTIPQGGLQFKPSVLLAFFSMISPFVIAFFLVMAGFFNKDIKGLVYLCGVLIALVIGGMMGPLFGDNTINSTNKPECFFIDLPFKTYLNFSLNSLFMGFTFFYLCFPMFSNGDYNISVLVSLLLISMLNMFLKFKQKCSSFIGILLGFIFGGLLGVAWFTIFYSTGYKSLTYFDIGKSNNVQCGKATGNTFKCNVIKNGKLVKSI